ncbi:MAG: DNA repair protein RecO [Motiliproteus sp.]
MDSQPAYVLHSFPYKDSSSLVDYLTSDFGRVRMIVKGVRRNGSRLREAIQPFQPLHISWRGKGELKTLIAAETISLNPFLQGRTLWCGLYLNELAVRLLPQWDSHPRLFAYYQLAVSTLSDLDAQESVLRIFERRLLEELGFEVSFTHTVNPEKAIEPHRYYYFNPEQGFSLAAEGAQPSSGQVCYPGDSILAIAEDDYHNDRVKQIAKRLMRVALGPHLGHKPLQSRELFKRQVVCQKENTTDFRNTEGE